MSTLLIDGDIVAYQIAFRTEEAIRVGQRSLDFTFR